MLPTGIWIPFHRSLWWQLSRCILYIYIYIYIYIFFFFFFSRIQGYLLVKIALLISPRDIPKIYGILESPWCLTLRMSYAPSLGPLGLTKFVWQPSLISRSYLEQAHSRAPTNFHRYLGFTYFSHLILSLLVYKCCAISLPHFSASLC